MSREGEVPDFFFLFNLSVLFAESPANEQRREDCAEKQGGSAWQR
jgi:hypothetical protein